MSTLRPCVAITAAAVTQLLAQLLGRECAAIKPGFPCLSLVPPQRPRNDPINRLIERKWGLLSSGAAAPARSGGFEPGFAPHRPKATRFRATGSGFHALWAELTQKSRFPHGSQARAPKHGKRARKISRISLFAPFRASRPLLSRDSSVTISPFS